MRGSEIILTAAAVLFLAAAAPAASGPGDSDLARYEGILMADPGHEVAFGRLLQEARVSGRLPEVLGRFQAKFKAGDEAAGLALARALTATGRTDEADAILASLTRYPEWAAFLAGEGLCRRGRGDGAIPFFERAAMSSADAGFRRNAWRRMGETARAAGRRDSVRAAIAGMKALAGNDSGAILDLAGDMDAWGEGLPALEMLRDLLPSVREPERRCRILEAGGRLAAAAGETDLAWGFWKDLILATRPGHWLRNVAYEGLQRVAASANRREALVALYREMDVREGEPDPGRALAGGRLWLELGRWDEAIASFERSGAQGGDDARRELIRALRRAGEAGRVRDLCATWRIAAAAEKRSFFDIEGMDALFALGRREDAEAALAGIDAARLATPDLARLADVLWSRAAAAPHVRVLEILGGRTDLDAGDRIARLPRVLAAAPDSAGAWLAGVSWREAGADGLRRAVAVFRRFRRPAEALALLDRGITVFPGRFDLILLQADLLREAGRPDEGLRRLEGMTLEGLAEEDVAAWQQTLVTVVEASGGIESGEATYRERAAKEPGRRMWTLAATALAARRAGEASPVAGPRRDVASRIGERLAGGRREDAEALWREHREALRRENRPPGADVLETVAGVFLRQGLVETAAAVWTAETDAGGADAALLESAARFFQRNGDPVRARACLDRLSGLSPAAGLSPDRTGELILAAGDFGAGLAQFQRVLAGTADFARRERIARRFVDACRGVWSPGTVAEWLRERLAAAPADTTLLDLYHETELARENPREVLPGMERLLAVRFDDPAFLRAVAGACEMAGRLEDAARLLRRVLEGGTGSLDEVRSVLARIERARGRMAAAEALLAEMEDARLAARVAMELHLAGTTGLLARFLSESPYDVWGNLEMARLEIRGGRARAAADRLERLDPVPAADAEEHLERLGEAWEAAGDPARVLAVGERLVAFHRGQGAEGSSRITPGVRAYYIVHHRVDVLARMAEEDLRRRPGEATLCQAFLDATVRDACRPEAALTVLLDLEEAAGGGREALLVRQFLDELLRGAPGLDRRLMDILEAERYLGDRNPGRLLRLVGFLERTGRTDAAIGWLAFRYTGDVLLHVRYTGLLFAADRSAEAEAVGSALLDRHRDDPRWLEARRGEPGLLSPRLLVTKLAALAHRRKDRGAVLRYLLNLPDILDPRQGLVEMGRVLLEYGYADDARRALEAAVALGADDPGADGCLARLAEAAGDYGNAWLLYRRSGLAAECAEVFRKDPEGVSKKAGEIVDGILREGEGRAGTAAYEAALVEAGELACLRRDWLRAIEWFEKAGARGVNPAVRHLLVHLHWQRKDFKKANALAAEMLRDALNPAERPSLAGGMEPLALLDLPWEGALDEHFYPVRCPWEEIALDLVYGHLRMKEGEKARDVLRTIPRGSAGYSLRVERAARAAADPGEVLALLGPFHAPAADMPPEAERELERARFLARMDRPDEAFGVCLGLLGEPRTGDALEQQVVREMAVLAKRRPGVVASFLRKAGAGAPGPWARAVLLRLAGDNDGAAALLRDIRREPPPGLPRGRADRLLLEILFDLRRNAEAAALLRDMAGSVRSADQREMMLRRMAELYRADGRAAEAAGVWISLLASPGAGDAADRLAAILPDLDDAALGQALDRFLLHPGEGAARVGVLAKALAGGGRFDPARRLWPLILAAADASAAIEAAEGYLAAGRKDEAREILGQARAALVGAERDRIESRLKDLGEPDGPRKDVRP
ncbi:MAG: hypothetical protein V1809_05690 [Planctomycetota bacterium]